MDNNKKKNNIEIRVLEIRNNAQFYLISAIIENIHYKVVTRYKSIEKFKSTAKIPSISATFPGNSFLNPTFGDSSRTDARRASLQVWLKEVLQKTPTIVAEFLQRQPEEHGPIENSLHFHPSWFFVNSKPSPMYWESQGTIQKHNYNLKYWPKLTEHLQLVPICSKVYGCRSLVGNELNSYSVGLYYLPWATYFKLGCLDIPKKPDSVSVNFRFCMDGKKIWMYVEYQILIFDLSDFSWKSATIPPTLQNYTYPLILVNAGKEIHVLGDRIHHAIDSTTFAIRLLPNITAEPSYNWCGVQARNYIFLCATSSCYVFNLSTETWETSLQLSKSVLPHVISAAYDNCNFVYVWGSKKAYRFDFRKKIWEDDIPDLVELQKIESGVSFVTHEFDHGNDLDDSFENLLLMNYFRQDKSWQTLLTNNQITKEEHDLMSEFDNLSMENIQDKFKIFLEHQKDYLMIYTKTQNPRIIYLNLLFLRLVPESEGLLDMKDHFREISKQDSSSTFHFKKIPGLIPPSSSPSPSPSRSSSPSPSLSSPSSLSSSISISVSSPSPSPSSSVSSYSASPYYLKTQTNRILNISSSPSPSTSPSSFSSFAPKELTQDEINYRTTVMQIIKERNIEIPDYLHCPITNQLIFEPVFTTDGHTYEREAIQKWFLSGNKTSPLTNEPLLSFTLTPNHLVKKIIILFLETHKLTEREVKIEK